MAQTQNSLGWGIIGIGRHADRFMVPAIQKSAKNHLVAAYSREMYRAKQFSDKHGHPLAYDSIEALLNNKDINAIYVGSPNNIHKEHVIMAAKAGKHVLCDKPLTTNVEDALEMIEACKKAGVKLGVGFHLRHNPVHTEVKERIRLGLIGKLLLAEVQYMHVISGAEATYRMPTWRQDPASAGGGSFMGTGVHAIDLLRYVSGKETVQLNAFADDNWNTFGTERLIHVSMLLQDNVVASLSAGLMKYPSNSVVLYGEKATLRCNGSVGYNGGGKIEINSDEGTRTTEFPPCNAYLSELDSFADNIHLGTEPNASGYDGLMAVEVTTGIYKSLRTESRVTLKNKSLSPS